MTVILTLVITCSAISGVTYFYRDRLTMVNEHVKHIENTYKNRLEDLLERNMELAVEVDRLEKQAEKWELFEERYKKAARAEIEHQSPEQSRTVVKRMRVTAYTEYECDKEPEHPEFRITTSGNEVAEWFTAAAGPELPFGTRIYIPYFKNHENNGIFVVEDRGGAIKNNCIDVYIADQMTVDDFGVKWLDVHILSY